MLRPCLEDGVPLAQVARQHGLGEEPLPGPLFPKPESASSTPPARPRLKSYFNE